MTRKTTNKFYPEVRARAVRMVAEKEVEHLSCWAAVCLIAADRQLCDTPPSMVISDPLVFSLPRRSIGLRRKETKLDACAFA